MVMKLPEIDEISPSEAERDRRRDRMRETRMVVDGAGIRRQAQALAARIHRPERTATHKDSRQIGL